MKLIRKINVCIERIFIEEIDDDMIEFVNEYVNSDLKVTEGMIKACYSDWTTNYAFSHKMFPELDNDTIEAIVDGVNMYLDNMDNYTDYTVSDEDEICGIATEDNGVFVAIDEVPVSDEDLKKYGFKK